MSFLWIIVNKLITVALAAIAVAAGWWMAIEWGPWVAIGVALAAALVAVGLGCLLLKTSSLGVVGWKNRLAGLLMPWGWQFSGGILSRAAVACTIIWVVLAGLGVLGNHLQSLPPAASPISVAGSPAGGPSMLLTSTMLTLWIIYGATALYLLGNVVRGGTGLLRAPMSIKKIVGLLLLIVVATVVLFVMGHHQIAFVILLAPVVAVALAFGAFMVVILTVGRKGNWH